MNNPKPEEKKKVRSNFTLDREVFKKLKDWSDTTGIPMSQIIESLVIEGLTDERLNALRTAITALQLDPITATSDNRHKVNEPERPLTKEEQMHFFNVVKATANKMVKKGMDDYKAMTRAYEWTKQAWAEGRIQ